MNEEKGNEDVGAVARRGADPGNVSAHAGPDHGAACRTRVTVAITAMHPSPPHDAITGRRLGSGPPEGPLTAAHRPAPPRLARVPPQLSGPHRDDGHRHRDLPRRRWVVVPAL